MADNNNAIGSASLLLRVDTSELSSGLAAGHDAITSWGDSLKSGIWAGIGIFIGGQIAHGIERAITSPLTAPFHLLGALRGELDAMFARVEQAGQTARALGVSPAFIQSLQLAGMEAHTVERGLERIAKLAEGAASGNRGNQAMFAGMAIDWRELRGAGLEEILARVADSVARIEEPMARIHTLEQMFGRRQAVQWVEAFARGAEGVREMRAEIERLGVGVTPEQANSVHSMVRAWDEVKLAIEGIWTQIGIGMAPALGQIGRDWKDFIADLVPTAQTIGVALATTVEVASAAFQELLNWIRSVTAGFEGWSGSASDVRATTLNVLQSMTEGAIWLFDEIKLYGVGAWQAVKTGLHELAKVMDSVITGYEAARIFVGVTDAEADQIADARIARNRMLRDLATPVTPPMPTDLAPVRAFFDRLRAVPGAAGGEMGRAAFAGMTAAAAALAGANRELRLTPALQEQIFTIQARVQDQITAATMGWSHQRAELERLADAAGNVDAAGRRMFEGAREAMARLEGLQLTDRFEPSRAMNLEFQRVGELFRRGAISAEVYAQAVNEAMGKAESALHISGEFRFAGAALGRSQEAVSTILRAQFGRPVENQQQRMQRILEEQRTIGAEQLNIQREMLRELARRDAPAAVGLL